jgi:integrase
MEVVFERESLFKEVWESPITTLAKKYGLSDNGLRKVCIALSIPLPHRDYWAKVKAGHKMRIATLPPSKGPTQFVSGANPEPAAPREKAAKDLTKDEIWLQEMLAFENDPINKVTVEAEFHAAHPAVVSAAKALKVRLAELQKSQEELERPRVYRPGQRWEPNWEALRLGGWRDYERGIAAYDGRKLTPLALRFLAHTSVRTGEMRGAEWPEFDLEGQQWRIPKERMKMGEQHVVSLSMQLLAILVDLKAFTGDGRYVFPSDRTTLGREEDAQAAYDTAIGLCENHAMRKFLVRKASRD